MKIRFKASKDVKYTTWNHGWDYTPTINLKDEGLAGFPSIHIVTQKATISNFYFDTFEGIHYFTLSLTDGVKFTDLDFHVESNAVWLGFNPKKAAGRKERQEEA